MPLKTRTRPNDTVKAAVALAEVTMQTCENMRGWRNQVSSPSTSDEPHKTDTFIGGVWEIMPNGFERITIAILTTHSSFYDDGDADSEDDGTPVLFVLLPDYGEIQCRFWRGGKVDLRYLKERYTCWQLNQLFGHDGKFEDLPKHIEALLS